MAPLVNMKLRQRTQLACASREAEGYLELGMHGHALSSLQRRGKLVHADAHACFLLGESLRELARYHEAVFPLRRSVTLKPKATDTWLALGWCYKRSGQLEQAIRSLEVAIRHTPDAPILHYNLACYYSLVHRRLDALRCLKRAFDLDRSLTSLVRDETDFDPMRNDIGLRMLLSAFA